MVVASLLSLALLALAGVLLDAHRGEWRGLAQSAPPDGASADRATADFERRRVRRRTTATSIIALVGVLVALWPVTPRAPGWVLAYTGTLASLALAILSLGLCDAWASAKHYRGVSRRRLEEHAERLREAIELHRASEREGAGA